MTVTMQQRTTVEQPAGEPVSFQAQVEAAMGTVMSELTGALGG